MTDLIAAAQQALDDLRDLHANHNITYAGTISRLEAALAQQQANPPGCDHCNHPLYAATRCRVCGRVTEQAEPVEPVAWLWKIKAVDEGPHTQQLYFFPGDDKPWSNGWTWTPLYTSPPQRKPLTKERLLYIYNQLPNWGMDMDRLPQGLEKFARAIERAHGINHSKPE